jgi:prepilin-type N-terminal cleavage/methylation domain-containing protein
MIALRRNGFTLIELLVVVAIIGLLATVAVIAFSGVSKKARDAKRLADMKQIRDAIEMYRQEYGAFPPNTDTDAGGLDLGCAGGPSSGDPFLAPLLNVGFKAPCDPRGTVMGNTYWYYLYPTGWVSNGCDDARGPYYILGIADLETTAGPAPTSPGFSCSLRNWQNEMEWVTGQFMN